MPQITVRTGVRLNYEISGAGEPLLLIMGTSGSIPLWGELVPRLALTREDRALRHLDDLRDVGDGAQLAQAAGLEDGHALEVSDLLFTGGPEALEVADQSHDVLVSFAA